jgi:hypothetical protein
MIDIYCFQTLLYWYWYSHWYWMPLLILRHYAIRLLPWYIIDYCHIDYWWLRHWLIDIIDIDTLFSPYWHYYWYFSFNITLILLTLHYWYWRYYDDITPFTDIDINTLAYYIITSHWHSSHYDRWPLLLHYIDALLLTLLTFSLYFHYITLITLADTYLADIIDYWAIIITTLLLIIDAWYYYASWLLPLLISHYYIHYWLRHYYFDIIIDIILRHEPFIIE